jgi:hypothetical protein
LKDLRKACRPEPAKPTRICCCFSNASRIFRAWEASQIVARPK